MTIVEGKYTARTEGSFSLDDRYRARGRDDSAMVHMTGIQALVRLLLDQRRHDAGRGLDTRAFVSGYEGSPLAGLDLELARRKALLDEHGVVFSPGLNEEAAATAVQGTRSWRRSTAACGTTGSSGRGTARPPGWIGRPTRCATPT